MPAPTPVPPPWSGCPATPTSWSCAPRPISAVPAALRSAWRAPLRPGTTGSGCSMTMRSPVRMRWRACWLPSPTRPGRPPGRTRCAAPCANLATWPCGTGATTTIPPPWNVRCRAPPMPGRRAGSIPLPSSASWCRPPPWPRSVFRTAVSSWPTTTPNIRCAWAAPGWGSGWCRTAWSNTCANAAAACAPGLSAASTTSPSATGSPSPAVTGVFPSFPAVSRWASAQHSGSPALGACAAARCGSCGGP